MTVRRAARLLAGVAALALALVLLRALPIAEALGPLTDWIRGAGILGALAFGLIYVVAAVAFLPASLLTLAAGFVWGPLVGTLVVSPASVAGATAAFLIGRFLARGWVERKLADNRTFAAIAGAVGSGGLKIVTLLRLSPIFPFNLLNYGLSLSPLRLRDFVLGSFVGMLPGTFMYVYLGSLASSVADLIAGRTPDSAGKPILFWGGLAATLVVTTLVTRSARAALRREVPASAAADAPTESPTTPAEA